MAYSDIKLNFCLFLLRAGGSTSPDEVSSQQQHNLADSSFSDEREENFESYGENEDVEYEA